MSLKYFLTALLNLLAHGFWCWEIVAQYLFFLLGYSVSRIHSVGLCVNVGCMVCTEKQGKFNALI